MTLQQVEPLIATLHWLRDFLSYGTTSPAFSSFEDRSYVTPPELQNAVKNIIASHGEVLVQRIMTGMMFSFPGDCFPDASGVLMTLFELIPQQASVWVKNTLQMLPAGTMKAGEAEKLMNGINQRIQANETRKVRVLLQGECRTMDVRPTIVDVLI